MKPGPVPNTHSESAAALLAVLFVIAIMASAVAVIYTVTTAEGRLMKRTVDRTRAIAYGDGVIQNLFDQWRLALSNTQDPTQHASGLTYNELMSGTATSPATSVPSPLPLKAPTSSQIPIPAGLALTAWSVRPADPYLNLIADSATRPTPENGTNSRMRVRTFYIASATVSFRGGKVTVERPFVRSGRNIFDNFLFSTQPVTEINPGASMYINGTIYAGGDLYTGTNSLNLQQDVSYTGNWTIGYAPGDPHASSPSTPKWPSGDAPHAGAQQKLLDTPLSSLDPNFIDGISSNDADSDSNLNNDGYHEMIEDLKSGSGTDPLQIDSSGSSERLSSNADYRIYIDASNDVTIYKGASATAMTSGADYTAIMGAITTNTTLSDGRENDNVRLVNVDVGRITNAVNAASDTYDTVGNNDGLLLYIDDTSAGTSVTTRGYSGYTTTATGNGNLTTTGGTARTSTSKRAIRLVNGGSLPTVGFAVATPNPVYIQGEYNSGATTNYSSTTGGTSTASALTVTNLPASDASGAYPSGTSAPDETSGTYVKKVAAIAADAVTILSNKWSDGNSTAGLTSGSRNPSNTTVNTAIVAGNVPTTTSAYSGGLENFPRLLENWTSSLYLTIHGSFSLLYDSEQATGVWQNTGNYYNAPSRRWFFDTTLQDKNPPGFPVAYAYSMAAWTLK
ncbi:MAG: hypothetical protein ABJF10_02415 [Chthoniobacter sp.]|uniref:hypothetical protein n=1 Tax=Chthoniobacter sp. TaxID=2510640 RepID=UPI0032A74F44